MEKTIKIRKGLDLNLAGVAQQQLHKAAPAQVYALVPDDFHGVKPRPVVKEGTHVKAGETLFVNKNDERPLRFAGQRNRQSDRTWRTAQDTEYSSDARQRNHLRIVRYTTRRGANG